MIVGFERFEKAFAPHRDAFILIGGIAVQMVLGQYETEKGVANRARITHDIDLLIVTDRISAGFKSTFRKFIADGQYDCYFAKERPHYYRFLNPKDTTYPAKLELLSHSLLSCPGIRHTPLVIERAESMSAMVLDENLYQYALTHYDERHGFRCLAPEALIVFKIVAYLNLMSEFEATGDSRRKNDALKHRNDVFRVLEHIVPSVRADLPQALVPRIREFITRFLSAGTGYLEWPSIAQAIAAPYLATDPAPLITAYNRLFEIRKENRK